MIQVVAKALVKEEKIGEYKEVAYTLIEMTRKEKGCISYELFQDRDDPRIMTFIERWQDMESLEEHFQAEHFKSLVPQLKDLRQSSELNIYELVK
ncbi:MAG: antibiotic biosynthesis monooxygenase [Synergistales bacterium]|nr:antibiotic biosynthesis monooxygenase [Synergistales bacterium]